MSALDGWIDVCRAGTWRDMAGRDVCLDEDRLDRIVAAHTSADPAPVVVGHPEANAPAYAWIDGLRRTGDRLQAKLRDIAPAFREAVEAGRYASRSIALQGDTLRHLGFLGGRAPAVPGLAPTCFASEPETVIAFAEEPPRHRLRRRSGLLRRFTGGANRARPYQPQLLVLGAHRVFPDLGAAGYTEIVGDDQFLRQIFHFGLGALDVDELRIGETALGSFEEVETEWADAQGSIALVAGNVDTVAGAALDDTDFVDRVSGANTRRIGIDIVGRLFPRRRQGQDQGTGRPAGDQVAGARRRRRHARGDARAFQPRHLSPDPQL